MAHTHFRRSGCLADDEFGRNGELPPDPMALKPFDENASRHFSHFVKRLSNRREAWNRVVREQNVIESNNGDVVGHTEGRISQCTDHADGRHDDDRVADRRPAHREDRWFP